MSDETNVNTAATQPGAPKKKKQTLIVAGVIIIAIVIVIALLVANALIQNQASSTADFSSPSWTISQSLSGPTTFSVQVTNNGGSYGSGKLVCFVNIGVSSYSNTQTFDLNAGSSTTLTVVVDTPYGTTVTKNMCGVYF